ncbi:MAG: AbrB/MazE/SpoVT family DNA-binding domain-containing protein [bacterium]|nr:AbrB/MazE/SpoVT family DNA-binding domain-containing protein [bacterium]
MKTTGVVRKLDELGRITLPIELRRSLNLDPKDELEIFVEDDQIILRKCESGDIFTGGTEDLIEYEGKTVSKHSIVEMAKIAGLSVTE